MIKEANSDKERLTLIMKTFKIRKKNVLAVRGR